MEGCYSCAAADLDVGSLKETGRALFKLLRSIYGRQLYGLDHPALLTINGDRIVFVLHSLFYLAASEYEDRPGNLWAAKGEPPPEGLPTLVKLSLLQYGLLENDPGVVRGARHRALLRSHPRPQHLLSQGLQRRGLQLMGHPLQGGCLCPHFYRPRYA